MSVVEAGQVEERAWGDKRHDLVEVDRRQLAFEQPGANVLEVHVPAIPRPSFDLGVVPEERGAAVPRCRLHPLVVRGEEHRAVTPERVP